MLPAPVLVWPELCTPIYVITLRPERIINLKQRLAQWASLLRLFSATNGMQIDRGRWRKDKIISSVCRLTRGELGCYDSHVRLWRTIVLKNLSHALILEDDVGIRYNEETSSRLNQALEELKTQRYSWDILYLASIPWVLEANSKEKIKGLKHWTQPKVCPGLMGYVITNSACKQLLHDCLPYNLPVDVFVINQINNGKLKAFLLNPMLAYTVPGISDTSTIK